MKLYAEQIEFNLTKLEEKLNDLIAFPYEIKPSTDSIRDVIDSSFKYARFGGNKMLPIDSLHGGVDMTDEKEHARVKSLAQKISSSDGYVSRIIVDDSNNVIEGQHRLEALKMLKQKFAPVSLIVNLENKYNSKEMEKAASKLNPDQMRQMVMNAMLALEEENGNVDEVLSNYEMPRHLQQIFNDVVKASLH